MKNIFIVAFFTVLMSSCGIDVEKKYVYKPTAFDSSYAIVYKDSSNAWLKNNLARFKYEESDNTKEVYMWVLHKKNATILIESGAILFLLLIVVFQRIKINNLNNKIR